MKNYLVVLILSALFPQTGSLPLSTVHGSHPLITTDTVIRIPETSAHSALHDLLAVAYDNHIPMGITLGDGPDEDICRATLDVQAGTMKIGELMAAIAAAAPRYGTNIQNGVLEVAPTAPSDAAVRFMNIRLNHFQSGSGDHRSLGLPLWRAIRGILAPGEGSNFVYPVSLSAETVQGVDVTNETVESIMDMIVDKGNGGVWILNSSQVKILSPEAPIPYEIYGYVGEDRSIVLNLGCAR